ncbi:hypothetical protein PoB_000498600 [Plakobranchus ocellatus]|uniref:Hexosyltransferase n=1 Tax=Plakobranchus ocellatus TaxID=259542 RepID=A0AAV3Y5L7_9GAST|nr:hypothetical protein PoB_000498600 [Plakobranchus ocellatus]
MASFRSRVFLLGLGLLLLMTIQIFRAHIDKGSMFLTSEEMVGSISEKDTSSENILKHSSVYHKRHSFVKPSVQEKEFSKGKKSSSSSLKNTDTPSASDSETYSQSSLVHEAKKNNTANISYSKQKDLALLYSSKDRFPKEPHDSDGVKKSKKESVEIVSYHSNRSRKSPLINETLRNSFKALLPKHQPEDLHTEGRTETYQNSLWIHPGELGTDFNYYNISLRSVREIADNITIDISRYMTGYPIGHAPVLLHNPDLCDVSFLEEYHRDMHHGLFLLVIIPSLPRHTEIRSIIRETWASAAYNGGFWAGREMAGKIVIHYIL